MVLAVPARSIAVSVRMTSKSSDGHESRRWREGASTRRDAELAPTEGLTFSSFVTCCTSTSLFWIFLSVINTTPFLALMPILVLPSPTAVKAYSIWSNLPLRLKVVKE